MPQKRPPTAFGRFVAAMRSEAYRRIASDPSKRALKGYILPGKSRLSREDVAAIAAADSTNGGSEITPETIRNYEYGRTKTPSPQRCLELLTALQLTADEIASVMPAFYGRGPTSYNPHLVSPEHRLLMHGEFGPLIDQTTVVGGWHTTWVEGEKASSGGFQDDEIVAFFLDAPIEEHCRHPSFRRFGRIADEALRANQARMEKGVRGWTNNPTLCLDSIVSRLKPDAEERTCITLRFLRSQYKYNVAAKADQGAEFRWAAVQESSFPPQPVNYLASGVGVCINVICDSGRHMVVGQRSDQETFRKGERDVAVVEGIRPTADIRGGRVDIRHACMRALNEELGLDQLARGKDAKDFTDRLCLFEFGLDLKYYQWNFLAFADVRLTFPQILDAWRKAKDRKENQRLDVVEFNRQSCIAYLTNNPFWSCGMACAIRTFDYYR
jgi:hypothetical protein